MSTMKVSRDNTQKKNITNRILNKLGFPASYAARFLDVFISLLISNIVDKHKIKIKNFGIFDLKKKGKRIGRNPRNNNKHMISERHVVTFKAAENLKKKININVKK